MWNVDIVFLGGGLGGGFGDEGAAGDGSSFGMGSGMGEGPGGYEGGDGSSGAFSDVSPYDLPVEIYGMVYIYNPISLRLQEATSQVTADTDLEGSTTTPTAPVDDTSAPPAATDATTPADAAPGAGAAAGGADPEIGDQLNQTAQAGG